MRRRGQSGVQARAAATFILLVAAAQWLLVVIGPSFWEVTNVWTAKSTAWTLRLFGAEARADGRYVQSSVFSFEVIRECTGVYPMLLFTAAILAYPGRWSSKAAGLVVGLPLLLAINTTRLVSLCYVGRTWPDSFERIHLVVWQPLLVFFTAFTWVLWATAVAGRHDTDPA